MIIARGPLRALEQPGLRWTDAGEPHSTVYDDCYFSAEQGDEETRHVFLDGSDLGGRFTHLAEPSFRIGELGFGTGLNFLLSWREFLRHAPAGARLHYWSVDRHPLTRESLATALQRWPELAELARELLDAYPPNLPGVHRRTLGEGRIQLDLVWADAADALADLASVDRPLVDAWYLDGFAPQRNADMWTPALFRMLATASRDGASVASYSAAGSVRRGLQDAGVVMHKRPGHGRKRECLGGTVQRDRSSPAPVMTPWDLPARAPLGCERALVLGAGLAGAHVAAALARRGSRVTVLDRGTSAGRASGNPQGVLFTRLSHQRSPLSEFSALAFLYAQSLYRRMFARGDLREGRDGELGGCLQQTNTDSDVPALTAALAGLEDFARFVNAADTLSLLGTRSEGGFWQPGSGWLSPPAVCAALLRDPLISVQQSCGELSVQRNQDTGHWELHDTDGTCIAAANILVVAAGSSSRGLLGDCELPLRAVRGQTTQLPAPPTRPLRSSLCHRGYIAPARNGEHCIGATFAPGDDDCAVRIEDHTENLERLAAALPEWRDYLASLDPAVLAGRAEVRCVSPDYLPLAGPVPDRDNFLHQYAALASDARRTVAIPGSYLPGLYLSTAHGSRGLSYAALSAELIASQVFDEPIPVSRQLQRAVSPARFLIRDLIRGRAKARAAAVNAA